MSTAPVLATKQCTTCGEMKSLSEFHRQRTAKDGLRNECKPCAVARSMAWQARKRAEIGEEAWKEHQRRIVQRTRAKNGTENNLRQSIAYRKALAALRERHRKEFDALYAIALREEELTVASSDLAGAGTAPIPAAGSEHGAVEQTAGLSSPVVSRSTSGKDGAPARTGATSQTTTA